MFVQHSDGHAGRLRQNLFPKILVSATTTTVLNSGQTVEVSRDKRVVSWRDGEDSALQRECYVNCAPVLENAKTVQLLMISCIYHHAYALSKITYLL